jgi:flagellum-specific ATP synthase
VLALHAEMADLVRLGAYRAGGDPAVDEAVRVAPRIEAMLRQDRENAVALGESFRQLQAAFD